MKKRFLFGFVTLLALTIVPLAGCSTTLKTSNLVNGAITVKAGSYYEVPFTITNAMTNSSVQGSFNASGGSGNDIIVLVFDDTSFFNWVNGHQATPIYNSGQLTTSNINASITTPGTYHLVFSNMFSLVTSKQVTTSVNLQYYQ